MILKKFIFLMFVSFLIIKVYAQVDTIKTFYPNGKIEAEVVYENNLDKVKPCFIGKMVILKKPEFMLMIKLKEQLKHFTIMDKLKKVIL
jgi:hypothetical protein